jgi:[ribosomal protein S18]-alanine N-acetyltransferase
MKQARISAVMQQDGQKGQDGMKKTMDVTVRKIRGRKEAECCTRLMSSSEPWLTLGRTYESALVMLGEPIRKVYTAMKGKELAGFIIIVLQGPFTGYIQTVIVAPEWRGKGVGSILIDFAEKLIFQQGPNVFMCVSSFNSGAQRLYERLGYQVVGELKDYIVAGHSEFLLRKTMGPLREFRRA